ncbi:MAG: GAF domain-containing sensor histidine kinase [Acidimicrobiales bacterium]|nr:GAF domain-containing sensor histidine kinase [Acidimicrobiales bacterium]MDG2216573.1 GAF domain-containing sensor histidine kinase [Acidimicrobiales bacterium]
MRPLARLGRTRDGYDQTDAGIIDHVDKVATFAPAILAVRWCMTAVSVALSADAFVRNDWKIVLWCVLVVSYTVIRTISPLRYMGNIRSLLEVFGEIAFHVAAVAATSYWNSPFVFSLLTAIMVAGFARGFGFGLRLAMGAAVAVSIADASRPDYGSQDLRISLQWSAIVILVGVVAGYARRISGEADQQHSLALDRLDRLSEANTLLFSLHRVARTLPASLDLSEVLDTTVVRLRGLVDFDSVAILVFDDTDASWQVIRREGAELPNRLDPTELPKPLMEAMSSKELVEIADLRLPNGPGISPNSSSGLYTVLTARGSIIGLLAVESRKLAAFGRREQELMNGFVDPVALAIDNARWFSRLRTVGADEERTRIARDLHDNIGQSLAYLAFELDRILSKDEEGGEIGPLLDQLRKDLRGVIGEVRDTLYDLRTDVSETLEIGEVLEQFAARMMERKDIDIKVYADQRGPRLPLLQEREMWRIAQEALVNVERHAEASGAAVRWRCDGNAAALEVADDGKGFPKGKAGRIDSYGMMGMRERATSIGATLELHSEEGRGTVIRCFLSADRNAGRSG